MKIIKPPETITQRDIVNVTHYDNMSNEERDLVFKAYEYDKDNQVYRLEQPRYLTEDIIKKLVA